MNLLVIEIKKNQGSQIILDYFFHDLNAIKKYTLLIVIFNKNANNLSCNEPLIIFLKQLFI